MLKVGDTIIIKEDFDLPIHSKGEIISSTGANFTIKMDHPPNCLITLRQSEFTRVPGTENIVTKKGDGIEGGIEGKILEILPFSHYLCKFDRPDGPWILDFAEDDIIAWDPKNKVFKLFEHVRVAEDIPEHNLKKGMEGFIVLVFSRPSLAYDVEFPPKGDALETYVLLPHQLELVESS